MMYDGREYRPNRFLGFRIAQAHNYDDADVYADGGFTTDAGDRITGMQVVIFRIKDAQTVGEDNRYYDPRSVAPQKCVPICAHTATNVALGVPKLKSSSAWPVINVGRGAGQRATPGQPFVEQAHYLVRDGKVYQWTSRRLATMDDE